MKKYLFTLFFSTALIISSCVYSISDVENTYRTGIERANNAQTIAELIQITIDVKNEIINGAQGFGGNRILTHEEIQRFRNAQYEFQMAIEKRHYVLTGNYSKLE